MVIVVIEARYYNCKTLEVENLQRAQVVLLLVMGVTLPLPRCLIVLLMLCLVETCGPLPADFPLWPQ